MTCPDAAVLAAWTEGRLPADATVEAHVASCRDCLDVVAATSLPQAPRGEVGHRWASWPIARAAAIVLVVAGVGGYGAGRLLELGARRLIEARIGARVGAFGLEKISTGRATIAVQDVRFPVGRLDRLELTARLAPPGIEDIVVHGLYLRLDLRRRPARDQSLPALPWPVEVQGGRLTILGERDEPIEVTELRGRFVPTPAGLDARLEGRFADAPIALGAAVRRRLPVGHDAARGWGIIDLEVAQAAALADVDHVTWARPRPGSRACLPFEIVESRVDGRLSLRLGVHSEARTVPWSPCQPDS